MVIVANKKKEFTVRRWTEASEKFIHGATNRGVLLTPPACFVMSEHIHSHSLLGLFRRLGFKREIFVLL